MPAPTFEAAGAGAAAAADNVAVAYPSGIVAGSLLVLQAITRDGDVNPAAMTADGGFTKLDAIDHGNNTGLSGVWIKKATGSESGTVTVTSSGGTNGAYGRMYRFEGWNDTGTLADVYEGLVNSGTTTSTTIADADVVTSGVDRLAVNLVFVCDDNALDAFTGMTGGTWAEAVAEFTSSTGNDAALGIQTATIASAGTIGGGTDTMAASDPWGVIGFAIRPATAAGDPVPRFARTRLQAVNRSSRW